MLGSSGVRLMLDLNLIGPGTADDWPAALSQIDALFSYTAQQPPRLRPFAFELGRMTRQGGVAPAVDSDSPHQPRCGQATRTRTSCTQPRRRRASQRWARCSQAVGRTRDSGRCWWGRRCTYSQTGSSTSCSRCRRRYLSTSLRTTCTKATARRRASPHRCRPSP